MPSASLPAPPVLSDGVVTLRRMRPEDVDDVVESSRDPLNIAWTTIPTPYERSDAEGFIALRSSNADWWAGPTWAITIAPSDRWSGTIDLRPDGAGAVEVGFLLAPWARGHGYAARALRLACAWAFTTLEASVVIWHAHVGNEASRSTARRVGFDVSDHVFRRYLTQRGERRDAWIGTLTPQDLAAAPGRAEGASRFLGPALTRRELDVLRQLTRGQSNRAIAAELGISENTVKNHVRSILEKLQAKSRAEAVVIGLRQGLTTIPS